jgi:alpha-beta hydrolase superfamily lysophospholipase
MGSLRRAGLAAAVAAAPVALAYRFALIYRVRAGYPERHPPRVTPGELGLPYEEVSIRAEAQALPGWFIPARGGASGPAVLLVHGWESARDRTLPIARFLHAAGLHVMTFDVRAHGANPPDALPISAGEFGADAAAAFAALVARPEVTTAAIAGHSMGGVGAILAAATDPRVAALVSTSAPADPYRLTRQTFRLARLPIPDLIAYPLAFVTTHVYVRPRGHTVRDISAARALARYEGPVLLAHGDLDEVVPVAHQGRLARIARRNRGRRVETLVVQGGRHSWLYEDPGYRRRVARFLAASLGGPLPPDEAGERAAATECLRLPDGEAPFAAVEAEPGGFRSLARVVGVVPAPQEIES